jgi:hypothetical protein
MGPARGLVRNDPETVTANGGDERRESGRIRGAEQGARERHRRIGVRAGGRPPPGRSRLNPEAAARIAWALWAVAIVSTLSAVVLLLVTRSVRPAHDPWQLGLLYNVGFLAYPPA